MFICVQAPIEIARDLQIITQKETDWGLQGEFSMEAAELGLKTCVCDPDKWSVLILF